MSAPVDAFDEPALQVLATSTVNPLASDPYRSWAFHRAEMTGFIGSPFRLPSGGPMPFGRVQTLDPRLLGPDRLVALAGRALDGLGEALERLPVPARLGVALCLREPHADGGLRRRIEQGRRRLESTVVRPLIERGHDVTLRAHDVGHAAGASACLDLGRSLAAGELDVGLVLGVDSHYDPLLLEELFAQQRVLDADSREAFVPGEAASALLLSGRQVARRLGVAPLGAVEVAAVGEESATRENDVGLLGLGLSRPAVHAAKRVKAAGDRLAWWLCDATGEPLRSQELSLVWPRAVRIAGGDAMATDLLPSTFGELGAATMPTAAVLAFEGLRRGAPEGRFALVTGSSDGGARGVLLLRAEAGRA